MTRHPDCDLNLDEELSFLENSERHQTLAETVYWCNQYRQHSIRAKAERAALKAALAELVQWADKEMGGPCNIQEIEQARAALGQ